MKLRRLIQNCPSRAKLSKEQRCASQQNCPADVADGSNPVLRGCRLNVRITPESGRIADIGGCLKCAISGREQMQQGAVLFDHLVGNGEHAWHPISDRRQSKNGLWLSVINGII